MRQEIKLHGLYFKDFQRNPQKRKSMFSPKVKFVMETTEKSTNKK